MVQVWIFGLDWATADVHWRTETVLFFRSWVREDTIVRAVQPWLKQLIQYSHNSIRMVYWHRCGV